MSAILEIPEVRQRVSPLSLQEYHRLDEFNEHGRRTELIRGIVIEKTSKAPLQSSSTINSRAWCRPILWFGARTRSPLPIQNRNRTFPSCRVPQPIFSR